MNRHTASFQRSSHCSVPVRLLPCRRSKHICQSLRNRSSFPVPFTVKPSLPPLAPGESRQLDFQQPGAREQLTIDKFDGSADEYDENMEEDELPSIFSMLEMADIREGETVLDLATGTGLVPDYVMNLVGPEGTVYGLDVSEGMLAKAQEKLDNTPGIDNLAFIHSSAEEADFGDNSLDVILCHNGVWYFQDHLRVVQNCKRWLRPSGGRFCYNVFEMPSHPAIPIFQAVLAEHGIEVREAAELLGNEKSIRQVFKDTGFDRVKIRRDSDTIQYPGVTEYAEDAWESCVDMTDFNYAEQELGSGFHKLRAAFIRAVKKDCNTRFSSLELKATHLWVMAIT